MKARFSVLVLLLLCIASLPRLVFAQDVQHGDVEVTSGGKVYQSYLAAPSSGGPYPGIVLIHSFNGLEDGYKTMTDKFAAQGFVVLAVGWQTFERSPSDDTVKQLVQDSVTFLSQRSDVDTKRLGLTGFCAGGRYTMLLLPQIDSFKAGVAWYGFPYQGSPAPADFIPQLKAPLLIIHGTADQASPIANIYRYVDDLQKANAYFELKVYFGKPHGFMVQGGKLQTDEVSEDAFNQMVSFFQRKLGSAES